LAPLTDSQRRDARRAHNRTEILDAAEKVFGELGVRHGSLRKIAAESGFSAAAIYLFFENKEHLLAEVLDRRADELSRALHELGGCDLPPLDKLHRIVDLTIVFFAERPDFRRLLRHLTGGDRIVGPTMTVLADIVRDGQDAGVVRDGDARALVHRCSVLLDEYVLLGSPGDPNVRTVTPAQFHDLVDGALRRPGVQTR
jgi:AcrR family transcriptional regulator